VGPHVSATAAPTTSHIRYKADGNVWPAMESFSVPYNYQSKEEACAAFAAIHGRTWYISGNQCVVNMVGPYGFYGAQYLRCPSGYTISYPTGICALGSYVANSSTCRINKSLGYLPYTPGPADLCSRITTQTTPKPSDGVCAARWTDASMTALQKDPLDPDCGANSCVMDGGCLLR
jgi:hypothetical protein